MPIIGLRLTPPKYKMKNSLLKTTRNLALGLLIIGSSVTLALATLPTYFTASGYGNTSSNATLCIPANPNCQARIVTIYYTSDNTAGGISFSSGTTAYSVTQTNGAATGITNFIGSTNGLTIGSVLCLQQGGVCYTNTLVSYGNASASNSLTGTFTNDCFAVVGTGAWGVVAQPGSSIYEMTPPTTIIVGAGTNELSGDDIYSGNYGRPVLVQLGPVTATNRLSTVSWHYDSQSQ
jgi:hypothetical protein